MNDYSKLGAQNFLQETYLAAPVARDAVWLVRAQRDTKEDRILGAYTTEALAWASIASAYRSRDHWRQFDLTPERVVLDSWQGD